MSTIQITHFIDNNHITPINRVMDYQQYNDGTHIPSATNNNQSSTFPNNMLYQSNSGSLVGNYYNQQNQQNNVGPNNLQTYNTIDQTTTQNVSPNGLQPHNEGYASYHRQLLQNQAMALAQLLIPGSESTQKLSPIQLQMPHDDHQINLNYAIEQNLTSSQQQSPSVTSSTQPTVSNLVNQKPPVYTKWTEQEDELLRAAVRIYGPHKWSLIATHVPNRTPMQCSARWVGALNPSILKGRWTSQEDNALKEAVSHYINTVDSQGNPQPIPWNKVSKRIPQRTGAQCQARWTEALDPCIRKGKWSPSEDEILKDGVRMYGRCWIRIAEMIDGRTQRQCRTRWLQIKNKQSRIKNDNIISGMTTAGAVANPKDDDSNENSSILTPPNTTPSTPAQKIKNGLSNSPDIIQGVILRSSPQTTLESPISNQSVSSEQSPTISDPATPISSPQFSSNYVVDTVETNTINNFNNCNMNFNNSENPFFIYNVQENQYNNNSYIEQYNNEYNQINQIPYFY